MSVRKLDYDVLKLNFPQLAMMRVFIWKKILLSSSFPALRINILKNVYPKCQGQKKNRDKNKNESNNTSVFLKDLQTAT